MGLNGTDCHLFDEQGIAFDRQLSVSALDPAEMHL
jgi:multiple sugar transport system ATP-binding protein